VEEGACASNLNLRLPAAAHGQLPALERWACEQLSRGELHWQTLPSQLKLSGAVLRQGLHSHRQGLPSSPQAALTMGLGGLLLQPEFQRSDSLRPLLQLVEEEPGQVLLSEHAGGLGGVWIGTEHPHPALGPCAVVQASYGAGADGLGHVALIGPMRMAYATARSAVQAVARTLERLLG
jgi:heat-inducible transcriptional repressor